MDYLIYHLHNKNIIIFCYYIMDRQVTTEDKEFMRWLDSKEGERFWEMNDEGERVILRSGWDRAQAEYNRIKGLKEKSENDLKVCGTLYHRE